MPHPMGRKVTDKVFVELIEADVEIGFALVDEAKAYRAAGQPELSTRALLNTEDILADIENRLLQLGDSGSGPFRLLVIELRNEITSLKR